MEREPINYELALRQHDAYCRFLEDAGAQVIKLSESIDYPDCCFIEDAAIVADEVVVITSMGAVSRRGETTAVEKELGKYREVAHIRLPATIDGGDCLRMGKTFYVGMSSRTNQPAIDELRRVLVPFGYRIIPVWVRASLHLKTACSAIDDETLLINSRWVDDEPFTGFRRIEVVEDEPWAANVVRVNRTIGLEASFQRTAEKVERIHDQVKMLDISEFRKAEGGLSCLSVLF